MSKSIDNKNIYIRDPKTGYNRIPIEGGFVVGHTKDMKLVFELVGEIGFDDAIDDVMSAVYHMCAVTLIASKNTPEAKDEIYKRTVQAFSLIMDKFYPEAKDRRSDVLDEKELEAVEKIIEENKELKNAGNK